MTAETFKGEVPKADTRGLEEIFSDFQFKTWEQAAEETDAFRENRIMICHFLTNAILPDVRLNERQAEMLKQGINRCAKMEDVRSNDEAFNMVLTIATWANSCKQ